MLIISVLTPKSASRRVLNNQILGARVDTLSLYLIYWALNLILALSNVDFERIDKRFGWVSVANFTLLVFLALRNTPLALLSGNSYEKLRPLHKVAGYTCIVTSVIHGITYTVVFAQKGKLEKYKERKNFSGVIAGIAMLIIGFSTIAYVVQESYEIFYVIHLLMFILILITIGMHRPDFSKSTKSWNFFGNNATVTPMKDGAARVTLKRSLYCSPGSHAFLWIPSIRWMETHPFTLISNEPAEFLIREYNGFTRDLLKIAREEPGKVLRCSVDGGYGQIANFMKFDRIVLVAGGSGATFTFNIALHVLKECAAESIARPIDFIWVVRHAASLKWFEKELQQLQDCPWINLLIHVTRDDAPSDELSSSGSIPVAGKSEKGPLAVENIDRGAPVIADIEKAKGEMTGQTSISVSVIRKGRPDIASLIADCLSQCSLGDRVGVGACGPMKIIESTREVTSRSVFDGWPLIDFYSEEFEW
ncbi:uncharacterized protein N7477_006115 [Penicillium maclennaniae]|uniref:uncharacterized protein n=1 Tax=Penicillium maclennaniae TaxID=1343394 RepID=UPI00254150AB|nr:uncharacterized protein N7477_006115 [Penicillium maclennaniae]KAJ5670752.1 hypothetical protein N7477_006115 [Penicillium maclennaniae]